MCLQHIKSVLAHLDITYGLWISPTNNNYSLQIILEACNSSIILLQKWCYPGTRNTLWTSLLHSCKQCVSWLLKLFESPTYMKRLHSKILRIRVHLHRPNVLIQCLHFPSFASVADIVETLYQWKGTLIVVWMIKMTILVILKQFYFDWCMKCTRFDTNIYH
jgi:hypothetical protein